jgi:hypothetical protein
MSSVPSGGKLARVACVLANLIIEAWVHTDYHAIGRFNVLEGELEGLLDLVGLVTHTTCRQYFETETGLIDLPNDLGHGKRI